ncbi:MAG: CBS domain-containing protein [Thermofilum sp.]|nr:CBS domain-containing protein [Thermofilum sp.]
MRVSELPIGRFPPLAVLPSNSSMLRVLVAMGRNRIRHIPLVNEEGRLDGMVSARGVVDFLGGKKYGEIVLSRFNGDVYRALEEVSVDAVRYNPPFVYRDADVREVIELMIDRGLGALAVVDDSLNVVGIVSERHVICLLADVSTHVKVKEIMTTEVIAASPMDTLQHCLKVMSDRHIRRLPLVSAGELRGIVTIKDVLSFLAREENILKLKSDKETVYSTPLFYLSSKPVITIEEEADVGVAVNYMKKHNIGALIVTRKGKITGVLTERDILTRLPRVKGVEIFLDEATKTMFGCRVSF